jgi:hypothetical protein
MMAEVNKKFLIGKREKIQPKNSRRIKAKTRLRQETGVFVSGTIMAAGKKYRDARTFNSLLCEVPRQFFHTGHNWQGHFSFIFWVKPQNLLIFYFFEYKKR